MLYKFFFIISFCLLQISLHSQKGIAQNRKNILFVPFDRFSFQSSFETSKIAEINKISTIDSVFDVFKKKFVEELSGKVEGYNFYELTPKERLKLSHRTQIVYKEKPVGHIGVDLREVSSSGMLQSLMENFEADYILFISRFQIRKRRLVTPQNFEGSKFTAWSSYAISYEVFDKLGNLVALNDEYDLRPKLPTVDTHSTLGLSLNGLTGKYERFKDEIVTRINKYEDKPIYK